MTDPKIRYGRVTTRTVEELKAIVGDRFVIFGDAEKLEPYSHDEVADKHYAHLPEAVVRTATAEEIISFCKEKLTAYKVPKLIEFRDSLPKSAVGKVLRKVLRAEEEEKKKKG